MPSFPRISRLACRPALVVAVAAIAVTAAPLGCASKPAERPGSAEPDAVGFAQPSGTPLATTSKTSPSLRGQTLAVRITDPALSDEFNNIFATGDIYLAGWPTEDGLKALAARGVKRVIALKTPEETMHARGYDPRVVARQLGMQLIVLPVRADSYGPADVDAFAAALDQSDGPVLVHCGSASTCAMLWSGYLAKKGGVTAEQAMDAARAAGLLEGPMTDSADRVVREILAKPAAPAAPGDAEK